MSFPQSLHQRVLVSFAIVALLVIGGGAYWLLRPPSAAHDVAETGSGIGWDDIAVAATGNYFTLEEVQRYDGPLVEFEELPDDVKAQLNPHEARMSLFEAEGDAAGARDKWFRDRQNYPADSYPFTAPLEALRQIQKMPPALAAAQPWEAIGPAPIEEGGLSNVSAQVEPSGVVRGNVSGRTKAIVFDPTNPQIVYVATATGGIWKSTDGGANYTLTTANVELPSLAFHSLAIAPSNPQILYAGTGEIAVAGGYGILKSTNGGQSWTLVGDDTFQNHVIANIVVDPQNPNRLWAASNLLAGFNARTRFPGQLVIKDNPGVYISEDGGTTWQPGIRCPNICDGFTSLKASPTNPLVQYAALHGAGLFRTTDGWQTSQQLPFPERGPSGPYGRLEIGIGSSGGQDVLYVGMESSKLVNVNGQQTTQAWGFVLKSTDSGQNWTVLDAPNYCGQQCFYDNVVTTVPDDANTVYLGGNASDIEDAQGNYLASPGAVFRSTDGGNRWFFAAPSVASDTATASQRAIHADIHAIAFEPNNPNAIWVGNDGGVARSRDGGATWDHPNNGLGTLQFIGIGVHPTNPDIVFGGMQDNGKAKWNGTRWVGIDTGDGGFSEIDPFDPTIWYSTRFNLPTIMQFQRNSNSGSAPPDEWENKTEGIGRDRVGFYAIFEPDRSTPGVLYWGTFRLYRTINRGDSWQVISPDLTRGVQTRGYLTAIKVAPSDARTIYTGSSDGLVYVTRDLGRNWTNTTRAPLPNRFVSDLAIHPTDPNIAYAVYAGYNRNTQQTPGHVFRTTDGGATWADVSNNLPDIPANAIEVDPKNPNEIYVGTDLGVFFSSDGGVSWAPLTQGGFPFVPVYDLDINNTTRYIYAATHGRGIYRARLDDGGGTAPPTPTALPSATPTQSVPTATLPPAGAVPGRYTGDDIELSVASDQRTLFNIRVRVPVPGCETSRVVVEQPVQADANGNFSFTVQSRGSGGFTVRGQLQRGMSGQVSNGSLAQDGTLSSIYLPYIVRASGGGTNPTATPTSQSGGSRPFVVGSTEFAAYNLQNESCDSSLTGTFSFRSPRTGDAEAAPTATPQVTIPPTATPQPEQQQGIHGQVTFNGQPASNITVFLIQCATGQACSIADEAARAGQARTDAGGYYAFTDPPTLPSGQYYEVQYQNNQDGGNNTNNQYLFVWYSRNITSYTAGQNLTVPTFDIADLLPVDPVDGSTRSLPITLQWQKRSVADALGEQYGWFLFNPLSGEFQCLNPTEALTQGTSSQLTRDYYTGTCGGQFGVEVGWAPVIRDTESGIGFGFYYGTFVASRAEPTATPVTPSPTATTNPAVSPTPTATTPPDATATPTATPTTVPADGLILNGSFEQSSANWQQSSRLGRILIGTPDASLGITARTGQHVAVLGAADNEVAVVSQQVTIPGAPLARQTWLFEYYYQIRSQEELCSTFFDKVAILLNGRTVTVGGEPQEEAMCQQTSTTDWKRKAFRLDNFVGQTITLGFGAETDSSIISFAAFDDVSLKLVPLSTLQAADGELFSGSGGLIDVPAGSTLQARPQPQPDDLPQVQQALPALSDVMQELSR